MNRTNKILWVVAVLLLILNLTTLGTIFYHNQKNKKDDVAIVLDENRQNPLTGRFFRQQLGFNDKQMDAFREANHEFQDKANGLIFEIDSLKSETFEELNSANPDTIRINELSTHIGKHHIELKNITNEFYLTVKSVCDSSQQEMLKEAFTPLFKDGSETNANIRYHRNRGNGNYPKFRNRRN